jgi:hypothetical protein
MHAADMVVALSLLVWLFLAPAFYDDGWVQARESMFRTAGNFSIYYTTLASPLPLGYWVEWLHHWIAAATPNLLGLRIPAFVCALTVWVLCRWMASRSGPGLGHVKPASVWILCCAFLLGALAWGMTLRPEPVVAVLTTSVAALVLHFLQKESLASLALAAALVALALTAHTTGILVLAPLLAAAPQLFVWARAHLAETAIFFAASASLAIVLMFVDSDMAQRRLDTSITSQFLVGAHDEFTRYEFLHSILTGTPMRRIAVGLLLLTAAAYVFRRVRTPSLHLDYPSRVLIAGLLLLFLIPSKWPWHFGALIGVGAVAAMSETTRLRIEAARSQNLTPWPFVAIAFAAAVAHWAWEVTKLWNAFDLRTLSWFPNLAAAIGFLALLCPVLLVLWFMAFGAGESREARHSGAAWKVASLTVPLMTVPAVIYTVGILSVDSARAESWTLARQNLTSLTGSAGCGLADDISVLVADTSQPLRVMASDASGARPEWVPMPPTPSTRTYALSPTRSGPATSPWFELPSNGRFGFYVTGRVGGTDRIALEWSRPGRRDRELLAASFTDILLDDVAGNVSWRFLSNGDLPPSPQGARLVRVSVSSPTRPAPLVAISALTSYKSKPLRNLLVRQKPTLVSPDVVPYLPCAQLPVQQHGIVEAPRHAAGTRLSFTELDEDIGNPFSGIEGALDVERLATFDAGSDRNELIVFRLRNPRNATLLPAASETTNS